ncbi:ABC transporter substrate binding protein [Desemzia sp. FAM 23991]|uniref:ABC transporter substrate binding protein n=1 Tax=unclassified Desemzia TaxID=2685243 RepID=UPI0038853563
MKKTTQMKKVVAGGITLLAGLVLAACGSGSSADDGSIDIGVLQFMEHESLSSARKGFLAELEDAGYKEGENLTVDYQNAQGDQANLQSMSQQLVGENDVILSIATPATQSLANETSGDPILFTAVTDAVDAGLVDSNEAPGRNITGTSDMVPIEEQIALLLSLTPEAESIGIIYNAGEPNSEIQANLAIEALEAEGVTVEVLTVASTNDVQQVLTTLAQDVDGLYIPTDNTLASTAATVGNIAIEYQLPVVAGSAEQVEAGGLATYGINYEDLGRQTAKMALKIIEEDADPADIAVETSDSLELVVNKEMAEALGIDPDSIVLPE